MPNQELFDFIKKLKEAGQEDEEIKQALKSAGWQDSDIKEGFHSQSLNAQPIQPAPVTPSTRSAPPLEPAQSIRPAQNYLDVLYGNKPEPPVITPESKSSKKLVAIIVVVFILLAGGASAYYFKDELRGLPVIKDWVKKVEPIVSDDKSQQPEQQQTAELPGSNRAPVTQQPAMNTATKKTPEPQVIDCGSSVNYQKIDCFINAARNCSLAKMNINAELDMSAVFGIIVKGSQLYEIRGWQENKCILYNKIMTNSVAFGQELVQKLLNSGKTMEQITEAEQVAAKSARATIGRDGICKFTDTSSLIDLFIKWQKGRFSSEDYKNIDCIGEVFGQPGQTANTAKTITSEECTNQNGRATAVTEAGTACFNSQSDLGTVIGSLKLDHKYPQCCL